MDKQLEQAIENANKRVGLLCQVGEYGPLVHRKAIKRRGGYYVRHQYYYWKVTGFREGYSGMFNVFSIERDEQYAPLS